MEFTENVPNLVPSFRKGSEEGNYGATRILQLGRERNDVRNKSIFLRHGREMVVMGKRGM
jgi:hypothetical protein